MFPRDYACGFLVPSAKVNRCAGVLEAARIAARPKTLHQNRMAPFLKIGVILLLSLLAACGRTSMCDKPDVVCIGSVGPLTGPLSYLGKDQENGVQLAVDEMNARPVLTLGGRKVRFHLTSEDDQGDPKKAASAAQTLIDTRVKGVIGYTDSTTSVPASKIYSEAGVPQISPSTTATAYTSQGHKTTFRVMTNQHQQALALSDFAVNKMGAKRVAVIDDRTMSGRELADDFAKSVVMAGGEVVQRADADDKSDAIEMLAASTKNKNPDLIFYGGTEARAEILVKQLRSLGMKTLFLGGDGVQTDGFIRLAGKDAEETMAASPGLPLEGMPGGKAFKAKYTARYGAVQSHAPYAYDAAMALMTAMQKADSADPAKYLPVLARLEMNGVSGTVAFDQNGDIKTGAVTIYRVKNGKWEVVETISK